MHAAGIYPAVVEIKQGAYGECIIDCFVCVAGRVQHFDVRRLNGDGVEIYFAYKPEKRLLRIRKLRGFGILEDGGDQLFVSQQFRRDRGVRLRSKRTLVQL